VAAVGYGFLTHSAAAAGTYLEDYGYYGVMVTAMLWLVMLWRSRSPAGLAFLGDGWREIWRRYGVLFVWIILLSLVAGLSGRYSNKVLYDEAVLQSTAFDMHFFRNAGTVIRGYEVEGVFTPFTAYLDKRPFFYPFMVSLTHDLTGYRTVNAFVFNNLLLPAVLLLFYWVGLGFGRREAALAGTVCFGASALLAQNAMGAGMDMLNVAMFLLTFGLAAHYLRAPGERRLSALILSCVLLAQTRYESALYVLPVALVILEGWRRSRRIILPWVAVAAPLFLIPVALHQTYLSGTPLLWELRDDMNSRFGFEHLINNLQHAYAFFFDVSGTLLNAVGLSVMGFAAFGWALWVLARSWRRLGHAQPSVLVTFLFGFTTIANLGLLMFYFWGELDDPIVSRLVLPFHAILGLAIVWALAQFNPAIRLRVAHWVTLVAVVTYLAFGLRATALFNDINQLADEITWEENWVDQRAPVPRMIITNKSALPWLLRKEPALSFDVLPGRLEGIRFHMMAGTFREVLVFQYYRPTGPQGDFVLDPANMLEDRVVLEPLIERRFGGRLLRISRVVEIGENPERSPVALEAEAAAGGETLVDQHQIN